MVSTSRLSKILAFVVFAALVLIGVATIAPTQAETLPRTPGPNIPASDVLNPDGTLNLRKGFSYCQFCP